MKKNILIIGLAGMLGISSGLISCSPDYETEFNVSTLVVPDKSQAPIAFSLEGGERSIDVQTNVPFDGWKAVSNAEWCKLTRQEDKVIVSVGENNIYKQRLAEITISYGHQSYSITVAQMGLKPTILIGDKMQESGYIESIDPEQSSLSIPIATNMELDNIIIPDTCASWIQLSDQSTVVKKVRAESIEKHELVFNLSQNTDTVERYCTVILQSSQNYSYTSSFVIKQLKRGYIVTIDDAHKVYDMTEIPGAITVPLKVNGPKKAYTYEIEGVTGDWITPAPAARGMRDANETFILKANETATSRTARIIFKSSDTNENTPNEVIVTINQRGYTGVAPICVENATATPGKGFITLNWDVPALKDYSRIEVSYHNPVTKVDKIIKIDDNTVKSCVVPDTYKCAGEYTFTIKTYGLKDLVTEHPVTVKGTSDEYPLMSSKPETLTVGMLSANATQTNDGGGLAALIDGDVNTYYHTLWGSFSPNSKHHYVQIDFSNAPIQVIRFEYDGRNTANNNGDPKRVGIWGSDTPNVEDSWKKIGTEIFTLPAKAGGHAIPDVNVIADKPYSYIRFIPESRRDIELDPTNKDKAWWNMGNLYVCKKNEKGEEWAQQQLDH